LISWKTEVSTHHPKNTFLEGLDFLLLAACDVFENPSSENIEYLLALTGDRSELLQKMRSRFLADNQEMTLEDRMIFLQSTSLYERAIWILGRIGILLRQASPEK
jgi:hypothetical protein